MPHFNIVNESSEDTLESTDDLQDAIRMARKIASQGQAGDPVSILESGGKAVRQFVLMPNGTVAEQAIARQVTLSGVDAELNRAEPGPTPSLPRE
jgi:hypothetical protein